MKKKFLSLIFAVVMFILAFPMPIAASDNIVVREIASELNYDYIYGFKDGFAIVEKRIGNVTKRGLIDKIGKEIALCIYDCNNEFIFIESFSHL